MRIRWASCILLWALGASQAWGEPYLAAWKGVNCNACHVNQTGGWMRSDYGKNYGNDLQTIDWQALSLPEPQSHKTPDYVSTGLDLHFNYTNNTFAAQPALYSPQSSFNSGRESFSFLAHPNEMVSGVVNYRIDNASNSEMYGLVSSLPAGGYIKIGAFGVPYGLTLADDNSLVRSGLLPLALTFQNVFNGVEAGFYPEDFFINAAVFNDPANTFQKIAAGKGGVHFADFTLGGSYYLQDMDLPNNQVRYGAFGWGRLWPVVILGEYDQGYDNAGTGQNDYNAYHVSVEADLGNDVYFRLAHEYLNHSLANSAVFDGYRNVASIRCYPVRNLKLQTDFQRLDATTGANQGIPGYGLLVDSFYFY